MNNQAIQHLLEEHREARRVALELEALLEGVAEDRQWTKARAEAFEKISGYLTGGLCRLIRKENDLLYPLLEAHLDRDSGPLANLRGEHASLWESCRRMCEAAKNLSDGGHPPATLQEFQLFGRRTVEVLRDHLYKEERVLFPMAARLLTPQQGSELLRKMEALKDPRPSGGDPLSRPKPT